MNKGRIAIVYEPSNLDTVPSLCSSAIMLAQNGYRVDIFTNISSCYKAPVFNNYDINLKDLHSTTIIEDMTQSRHDNVVKLKRLGFIYVVTRGFYRLIKWSSRHLSKFIRMIQVLKLHRQNRYRCFIGVDPEGLVTARSLTRLFRVPLVYYSLELLLSEEITKPENKRLKEKEIGLSGRAGFIIIQDKDRAQLLIADNHLSKDNFVYVPNSPLGTARRRPSRYWHNFFDLAPEKKIVLHAGSVGHWTGIEEIVKSIADWPENWVLVVHRRYDSASSEYIDKLKKLAPTGRVLFSIKPVSRQEYESLVDGADIGIAFYIPTIGSTYTQRNIETIGLSSGKIAYYLQAGVPVIINNVASVSGIIEDAGCGVAVKDADEISKAISQIEQNYQNYSNRSCEVFDKIFSFERGFNEVIKHIDEMGR